MDVPCIIKIKELTDFKWDKLCVFAYGTRQDEIEKTIGTNFPDYVEFQRRTIFLNEGKITHRENEDVNIEGTTNGEVVFEGVKTGSSYLCFTPDNAAFTATKYKTDYAVTYILKQRK